MKLERQIFIPTEYDQKIEVKNLWEIYYLTKSYNGKDYYIGKYFGEKRSKPDANYRFETKEQREKYTEQFMAKVRGWVARRNKAKEERKQWKHSYKVGDILYSSWGYDQTNIDFYQITALVGEKMVTIQQIGSKILECTGYESYRVTADTTKKIDEPMTKIAGKYGIKLTSYASANTWGGEPMYKTCYA